MPKSIILFERVAYLALLLGLTSLVLNWSEIDDFYRQQPIAYLFTQIITFGSQILFIWLIARRRKNWARWLWLVLTFGGTAIAIVVQISQPLQLGGLAGSIAFYLAYLTSLLS